jgi:hypothetical protein
MALLYPWATKEYLLWNMTIGQIIFYHNKGIEIKNGIVSKDGPSLLNKSADELRKMRDEYKKQIEIEHKALAEKYGDIG